MLMTTRYLYWTPASFIMRGGIDMNTHRSHTLSAYFLTRPLVTMTLYSVDLHWLSSRTSPKQSQLNDT